MLDNIVIEPINFKMILFGAFIVVTAIMIQLSFPWKK